MSEARSSTVWQRLMMDRPLWGWSGSPSALRGRAVGPVVSVTSCPTRSGPAPARSGFHSIPTLTQPHSTTSTESRRFHEVSLAPHVRSGDRYAVFSPPRFDVHCSALDKHPRASRCGPVALRASTNLVTVGSASLASGRQRLKGRWATPPEPPKSARAANSEEGRQGFVRLGELARARLGSIPRPWKR
jgi:hypothetical protein